jgi:hypothetical protein
MDKLSDLTMTESEQVELEAALDQCLVEIKQLRDECEQLGATTDERLRRLHREREHSQTRRGPYVA